MTGTGSVWRTAHGHGFPLVVVHGTMDRSTSFGRLVRALDGFHVTRYDRRGYGRSIELGPPDSFAQQVEDLTEVVGAQPAVVVGHSYGGTVALAASIAHRPIAGAVVYECPMPWMPWWPARSAGAAAMADAADPADAAERFMRRMIGDRRWEKLPPSTRAARRAEGVTLVAEMQHVRPPSGAAFAIEDLPVPVLAVHGSQGADHHATSIRTIAGTAPLGVYARIEGAPHGVHLTHPREFAALIREFVTGLD